MFAKIFESEKYGQLLVKADTCEEYKPEVRVYCNPPGLGICSVSLSFTDDEEGWDKQEEAFNMIDIEMAEHMAKTPYELIEENK